MQIFIIIFLMGLAYIPFSPNVSQFSTYKSLIVGAIYGMAVSVLGVVGLHFAVDLSVNFSEPFDIFLNFGTVLVYAAAISRSFYKINGGS